MTAATAEAGPDGAAPDAGAARDPVRDPVRDPADDRPCVAARVAAALAAAGPGRAVVAGDLPPAVHEALPPGIALEGADAAAGGAGHVPAVPPGSEPVAPHTALLVLDAPREGAELERRLGTACRRFPGRLLVWQRDGLVHDAPPVPPERFFAFGFRRLFVTVEDGVRHALHEYRLADYKQPPDWLNARFWANPARFAIDPDTETREDEPAPDA